MYVYINIENIIVINKFFINNIYKVVKFFKCVISSGILVILLFSKLL